jgi:carboxyl-terminal processing protease
MSAKEVREMSEKISGSYAGIGAYVSTEEGILVIQSPIYGGPAYKAGIRALDKVLEIDGTKTTELTITECVNRMKGEPKTPVKLKIWRASFREPKEIVVLRDNINMPKLYTLLPGKIGYVRLTTYGKNTGKELQEMMDEMREQGMRALVLDLRNNPGGLLNAAVDVVGKFVKRGAEVVTVRPRAGIAEMERHVSAEPSPDLEIPLVVLINGGSASASEITAGALLDYGRAKLVGTRSYGKGSVQTLLPVRTTGYKTRLRLTIAKYYLPRTEKYPDGRCIHRNPKSENKDERRGGVKPDLFCRFVEFEGWIEDEIINFRTTDATFKYWKQNYNEQTKKTFEDLAENDGGDWKKYPGFEEWAKSLNTKLPYDDLRRELRRYVRLQVADLLGKAYVADVEEDNQLQRAIISLYQDHFKKEDGKAVPEYKGFFEKFEQNKFLGLTPRKDGLEEE